MNLFKKNKRKIKKNTGKSQYVGTARPKQHYAGLYAGITLVCAYLGYLCGAAIMAGGGITRLQTGLSIVLQTPLRFYAGKATLAGVFTGLMIAGFIILWHAATPHKYIQGIEQGEEDWGDVGEMRQRLTDPEEEYNRILTEHFSMSIRAEVTDLNNNVLIIAGPGGGKTHRLIRPNVQKGIDSMAITDPKGEILRTCGRYLESKGYVVRVLNLIDMKKSMHYNPFAFLRDENDILSILNVFFDNTEEPDARKGEQFWRDTEKMFDQAIITYLLYEETNPTFKRVVELANMASVISDSNGNRLPSDLDRVFEKLSDTHPAKILYKKVTTSADDTLRSIIISAQARLNIFSNSDLAKLMSDNEFNFFEIGMGAGDDKKKTALFLVIPDVDKTYNTVAAMMYTQLTQELYRAADGTETGRLKIPVTMWLDEYYNVAMPKNFLTYLATMRGRLISACIVVQNIAQLKDRYKDLWETVPGCCDTIVFLGGNGLETNKWLSEELGKATFDKKTHSESLGMQGNSSLNMDVYGRSLLEPSELRRLPRSKMVVIIAGEMPIYDDKYRTEEKEEFKAARKAGVYYQKDDNEKKGDGASAIIRKFTDDSRILEIFTKMEKGAAVLSAGERAQLTDFCKKANIPIEKIEIKEQNEPISEDPEEVALRKYFKEYDNESYSIIRDAVINGVPAEEIKKMLQPGFHKETIRAILASETNESWKQLVAAGNTRGSVNPL